MPTVRHGMNAVEIGPLVAEALAARPYVRPRYRALFERLFAELWDTGDVLRQMRKSELPFDFFAERLGGRTERQALEVLINRISSGVYRAAGRLDEERLRNRGRPSLYSHAKCVSDTFYSCAKGRRMNGKIVRLEDRTDFPLPGCKADWCACSWRPLLPREMRELGLE